MMTTVTLFVYVPNTDLFGSRFFYPSRKIFFNILAFNRLRMRLLGLFFYVRFSLEIFAETKTHKIMKSKQLITILACIVSLCSSTIVSANAGGSIPVPPITRNEAVLIQQVTIPNEIHPAAIAK